LFFLRCGLVWFDSVGKKNPQTEPNHVAELKNDPNTSKPNVVFYGFGFGWFDLHFFWIGSVLNNPTFDSFQT